MAKKVGGETPRPTHAEMIERIREMGQMLGKTAEIQSGAVYKHDCVWKDNPYANPRVVFEVCDKGNLDKDIASLHWANQNWRAHSILVVFDDSDFIAAQKKLAQEKQIYLLKVADMLQLHSMSKAGCIEAVRCIFAI